MYFHNNVFVASLFSFVVFFVLLKFLCYCLTGICTTDKCDLFTGEWIPNPSGPLYTNESCRFIEPPQNCMKNGRPDVGYLFWRWKPHGCHVPPFNATKFLETMQNRSWALVGDSILRNHAQSLICLLSKVNFINSI